MLVMVAWLALVTLVTLLILFLTKLLRITILLLLPFSLVTETSKVEFTLKQELTIWLLLLWLLPMLLLVTLTLTSKLNLWARTKTVTTFSWEISGLPEKKLKLLLLRSLLLKCSLKTTQELLRELIDGTVFKSSKESNTNGRKNLLIFTILLSSTANWN